MASRLEVLQSAVQEVLGDKVKQSTLALDELTVVCEVDNVIDVATLLRDHADLAFEQCSDLCGVDYSTYQDGTWSGARYAVVYQLISYRHNWRIRLKTFAKDDAFPIVPSVVDIWNGVNWYEREAFDLFGILFDGHPDLRRILTDYGFIGHPFRKDFPLSGYVEMRYDATEARVVYQPVTIEPREITPRIIREENYGG